MDESLDFRSIITGVFRDLLEGMMDFVPRAITAIIIIVIGIILAKIAERVVKTLFEKLKLNALLDRIGVTQTLQGIGLQDTPGRVLARAVYILLIVLFVQSVTREVGLDAIADAIGGFFSYLPNLVAAFLLFMLGMITARFVNKAVSQSGRDSGLENAELLGRLVSSLILFVVGIMAIAQLQIDTAIINMFVQVLLSGFALAIALSFGLGTRDITRNMIAGFYARKVFRAGEEVELAGERGVLTGITTLSTLIETDGRTVAVPNRVFLDEVVRQ